VKHIAWTYMVVAALALGACGNPNDPENANRETPENRLAGGGSDSGGHVVPREEFGPEMAMAGTYVTRFEHADFNGCWLSMTAEAAADFRRRFPPDSAGSPQNGGTYRLSIIGRHSIDPASGPPSYGHMGGWRCEIRVSRIVSAEAVGRPDARPVGKIGNDTRQGLDAGHDQAMLEEIRRRVGQ